MINSKWLRQPVPEDVPKIAAGIREADLIECLAQGESPTQALTNGMRHSDMVQTVLWEGEPVGMFGVSPGGFIWLLGTPDMVRGPASIRFLRESPASVDAAVRRYGVIGNVSWTGNHTHHRWLEHLGFKIRRDLPLKIGGVDHFYFWRDS